MVYCGSKNRYCKYIIPILQKYINDNQITKFYDIFCGGSNISDKIINCQVYASDYEPSLIALHKKAQTEPELIPEHCTREDWDETYTEYKRLMKNYPKEEWAKESKVPLWWMGAVQFYASFSNRCFAGGYAKPSHGRDYYNEAYRNHQKQSSTDTYKKIIFTQSNYLNLSIKPNALIYADSPYKGVKPYQINPKFNYEEYYNWLREQSKTNPIFISEQSMPEDFQIIWSKDDVTRTAGLDNNYKACEKLFFIDNR